MPDDRNLFSKLQTCGNEILRSLIHQKYNKSNQIVHHRSCHSVLIFPAKCGTNTVIRLVYCSTALRRSSIA
ncbi:MAG TPA: hypothetical protein DEA91_02175 [Paenibacillus sp.]|nr:hypothetical protein [Paenibacillus sp.]